MPLYIFYHPRSALQLATGNSRAIEGINLVFASHVAPVVLGGCTRKEKKVDYWRDRFMPLSDILCWPALLGPRLPGAPDTTFVIGPGAEPLGAIGGFHPDLVARRLRLRYERAPVAAATDTTARVIEPANEIPAEIRRALEGNVTADDRRRLKRPRVILATPLRREDSAFTVADEVSRGQDEWG